MFRDLVELQWLLRNVSLSSEALNQLQPLKLHTLIKHAYEIVSWNIWDNLLGSILRLPILFRRGF
jgi:hypothetical protein